MIFHWSKHCESCDLLKELLEVERATNKRLLDKLLEKPHEELPTPVQIEPIRPKITSFRVQREMLESEDREKARILKKRELELSELEKEVGVAQNDGTNEQSN